MAVPTHTPWHNEISRLALFISIPQLIASPIIVGISHFVMPQNVAFEGKEILDFLIISFPLTLCVAVLFVIIAKGKFNLFYMVFAVAAAALLSNLLHIIVGKIPSVNIKSTLDTSYNETSGGSDSAFKWVFNMFAVYWENFGPIIFIQSCCIGIYAGDKFLKMEKKKKDIRK